MAATEQRRAVRIPVEVEVHVTRSSEHNFYTGFTRDISEGGLFISTGHIVPIGTEIRFEFRLDDEPKAIEAQGIVRWVREHDSIRTDDVQTGLGVQFTQLDGATQGRINRFIARRRESLFMDLD